MLFVGTQTNDASRRIEIDFDGLLHHTLVVGQSGSGKSFLVARIVEEILVRSRARVVVIDPNGDFRRVNEPSPDAWIKFSDTFSNLDKLTARSNDISFDQEDRFNDSWRKRRFIYLSPTRSVHLKESRNTDHRLYVHWDTLDADQRSFLLNANSSTEPKVFLGLKAVAENVDWVSQYKPNAGIKKDLRGMLDVAKYFAESNISLRDYEYAKILNRDDWYSVQAKIDDILSQYTLWWSAGGAGSNKRPPGLDDFIDGAFEDRPKALTYWDAMVLSLEAAPPRDSLLAADVALARLWFRAKNEWRLRAASSNSSRVDTRVPTFIVVDEAHNFAPDQSTDPLRSRVTSRLMQIASEGRKYGLYLILASQRPTKLHSELVAECENACVLRLQSKIETDFAVSVLGLSEAEAHAVPSFTKGQGVFFGRWVGGTAQMNTKIAPARTVVGGGEIASGWKALPEPKVDFAQEEAQIAEFIVQLLRGTDAPIALATLATQIRNKFGEPETLNWYGHESFKEFILSLNIATILLSDTPPGYAYLEGSQSPPETKLTSPPQQLGDLSDQERNVAGLIRIHLNAPIFPFEELSKLFKIISDEVSANEFNLSDTSKAIRDRSIEAGIHVGRNAINFILKAIHLSGHHFDADFSQEPKPLAEAFTRWLTHSLLQKDLSLSTEAESTLRSLYSGGILVGTDEQKGEAGVCVLADLDEPDQPPQPSLADVPLETDVSTLILSPAASEDRISSKRAPRAKK